MNKKIKATFSIDRDYLVERIEKAFGPLRATVTDEELANALGRNVTSFFKEGGGDDYFYDSSSADETDFLTLIEPSDDDD